MASLPDYLKRIMGWDRTAKQIADRNAELEHLDAHRLVLEGYSQQYKDKSAEYVTVSARKLELSQELRDLFRQGETLVDYLRTGVRQHYGLNNEILFAFDMTPTSRRARRAKPVEQPAQPVPVPDPAK
jgi:hypothetical protein